MTIKFTLEQQLDLLSRSVWPLMKAIKSGYDYDPGDSDLDDEQPINVHASMTLGEYRTACNLFYELMQNPDSLVVTEHVWFEREENMAELRESRDGFRTMYETLVEYAQNKNKEIARLKAQLAEAERKARLDEAMWWKPKAYIGHSYDCSLNSTDSPNGDFCDCDRKARDREVDARLAALSAPAKEGEPDEA